MLAHEAWLGLRVSARGERGFVRVHERAADASALYTVFDWHGGRTLEQMLQRERRGPRGRGGGRRHRRWRSALGRLHRHGVVHRDIKPGNLHLGDDGRWRILDLGVALSGREGAAQRELHAGTPSYMNPEQWERRGAPTPRSDLFALGVTLYQWLTGRLPYGEIEPYQAARYRRDPARPRASGPTCRSGSTTWCCKAVARDPRQRFETAEELLLALERGASRPVDAPAATPLIAARPGRAAGRSRSAVSLLFNALLIVLAAVPAALS